MEFKSFITTGLRIFNYFNFSSPETTILQSPSKLSTSPCNKTPLKPYNSQVPSIRSFHPNESNPCINIQKTTRGYLTRRKLAAINWTNDQLKDASLTNINFEQEDYRKPTLLYRIAKKEIIIPNHLSLSLIIKFLNFQKHNKNFKEIDRVNYKDDWNWTPLHWASKTGNLEVLKLLIENKAKLEAKDFDSYTPLHLAAQHGHPEIAKVLIEKGADLNAKVESGNTPLHLAAQNGHPEIAKVLIENKANLEAKDFDSYTPLHLAAQNGHPEIAKVLIENGADLNTIGEGNYTPFHMALIKGDLDLAKLLNITDHLDRYDSIDSLSFEFEGLTVDQKDFYSEHQQQIESLMDKRAENLLKKAITELNKDISLATIKRGKSFLESYGQVPNLTALSAIVIQNNIKKYENDPHFNFLKEDPLNQKSIFTSYPTFEQINHARYLLNVLKDNIHQANINYSNQATTNICDLGHH